MNKITEDERFIKIQGILAFSDVHPADCIKINDLIIELSKELEELKEIEKEHQKINGDLRVEIKELQDRIDKALEKIQLLIDIGFDYDGFNKADSLKTLIDELVNFARDSRAILKGGKK